MSAENAGAVPGGPAGVDLNTGQSFAASQPGSAIATLATRVAPNLRRKPRDDAAFAPDFLVIGAMKAGTTTLSRYLEQFEEIGQARTKETDYFILEKNHSLGAAWYRSQFDRSRSLCGEASPNYTKHDIFPGVPERIASAAPDAKLIFIARDPVARFASHYRHSWNHGHMRVEPDALLTSRNGRHMVECSRYAAQMDRYLAHFDRQQFLFLDFEELCRAPQRVGDQVAGFLGIPPRALRIEQPANTTEQIAQIPGLLKRAARLPLVRKLDRFIPKSTRKLVRDAWSFRKPDAAPQLSEGLLAEVADLLRADAGRFREMAGRDFNQWRV